MDHIRSKLLRGVEIRSTDKGHSETQLPEDSPTGMPIIYINDSLYKGMARDKMIAAESIHLLKLADPDRHKKLMDTALADPEYMDWAQTSYDYLSGKIPNPETGLFDIDEKDYEKRDFDKWHNVSRFDQVIGGYIYSQDPDLPTMKNWNRYELPMGTELRAELESFREDFQTPQVAIPNKRY